MSCELFNCAEEARQLLTQLKRLTRSCHTEFAVFIEQGRPVLVQRNSDDYMGKLACIKRFVGVYTSGITAKALADDLRATLYVMPISSVKVV